MRVLALLLAMTIMLLISLVLKIRVDFRYRRIREEDHIDLDFRMFGGLWRANYQIPTVRLEWEKGPQLEFEQVAKTKGGTRKAKTKARIRYIRRRWLSRLWLKLPNIMSFFKFLKKQFYKGIHCKDLNWQVEIGCKDACQTALAAGAFWVMIGFAMSHLYRQVTMEVPAPKLQVVPQYDKEGFFCDFQCIFHLRIGHIIFVGWTLLRAIIRGIRG